MKNKETNKTLEEITVVLTPLENIISKIPLIKKIYLKTYEVMIKNKLSDYKINFK